MNFLMVIQPIEEYQNKEKFCMPLGIAYVNGAMRAAGFHVDGINMMFVNGDPYEALKKKIRDFHADAIMCGGLSSEFPVLKRVFDTAREVKEDIILIGGGGGFTSEPVLFSELTGVDYAVIGEGEITNPTLAAAIENGTDPSEIPGIVYRKDGKYYQTPPCPVIRDIDSLPFPSYEGLAMEEYLSRQQVDSWYNYFTYYSDEPRLMPMMMSRSCPYNCSFCFHPIGKGHRARSIDNFFQELDLWVEKYQINGIALVDECFSINPKRVLEFCARIKPYHLAWACQMRAELYDSDVIAAMRDSGCIGACFGIESMSQTVLDNMQKHLKQETIENALQLSYQYQVGASGNLIFGAETETFDTIYESVSWNRNHIKHWRHHPITTFTYIQTYPGSRYYENACQKGIIPDRGAFIQSGRWIQNITGLSDHDYRIIGEAARIWQHEPRDTGKILNLEEQEDGRLTLTFRCPHCGSEHTYRNLSRKHLEKGRIRDLGCRTCNGLADYEIVPENYPYRHYVTAYWLIEHFATDDLETWFLKKDWKRVGILGAGFAAEKLIRQICAGKKVEVSFVLVRKGTPVFEGTMPFLSDLPEDPQCDVLIDTDLIHFQWRREKVEACTKIPVCSLEDILRDASLEDMSYFEF